MSIKYDRQEVIEKATNLFWEKGFHATSMRNIQEAIDLRPGSIYASFGSKEGLFKEALHYYASAGLEQLAANAKSSPSPLEALKTFIRNAVTGTSSAPSNMCMLVKSVAELTENDNAELLAEAKQYLHSIEDAFTTLLAQAKEGGEIDTSKDPRRLARFLQMQLMGLRSYARANDGNIPTDELLEDAFSCLN